MAPETVLAMSESSSPTPRKPQIDVRRLSLVQLQALAARGSRRARAELQARMDAPPSAPASAPTRTAPAATPPMPLPGALAATERASAAASASDAQDPRIHELEFLARQDREDAHARGLPRLFGLILMGWGGLFVFAGLVTLAHRGGGYYLVMGAATIAIGWLLLKAKFWAIYLQAAAVLIALAWAWSNSRSLAGMLAITGMFAQAAPFWIPACWMAVPQVREPLD
jgi:hypothetical protein